MKSSLAILLAALLSSVTASVTFFDQSRNVQQVVAPDAKTLGSNSVPGENPLEYCPKESRTDFLVDIEYVNLTPNPPARGSTLTIEAKGKVKKRIEEGAYCKVEVKYGLIRLVNTQIDMCEQMSNVDMKCPIEEGDMQITKDVELPNEIPPGKFIVNADCFTVDDERLTCLTATVTFPAAFFS